MKSRIAYLLEKWSLGRTYLYWYHYSFANRLTMLSLTLSLCGIVFVSFTSLVIVFTVVQEKERELFAKDLSVGATRLTASLEAINQQVADLARNAALVNGLVDNSQREAYIRPLISSIQFANLRHYQIMVRNYQGERLIVYDHALGFSVPSEEILKSEAQEDLRINIPSAHVDVEGNSTWLGISYPISFPDSNEPQGILTLELPLSDMLGNWLAPERDPRDWKLTWGAANLMQQIDLQEPTKERAEFVQQSLQLPAPLNALGLQLQLQANAYQALQAIYWLLPFFALIAIVSVAMAAIVSRWLGRRMAGPIVALAKAAREVAITGRPTIALHAQGADEIGQLTRDFNSMLSELALLQEHLQASIATRSARLSTIFELSPDGFIAFDQRGVVSFVNPAFTALTGIERNEVLAHDWPHLHQLIGARLAHDSVFPTELAEQLMVQLHTPSLKTFLVFKRISDQGEVILYWRDFTREAEMDVMKTAFLAKAAHELRTPLTSILGFTELLQKDANANNKQKEIFAIMARQGNSLLNLVRDLLDLARIEAQAQKTHQQSLQSLSALTRLIVEEFKVPGDERKFILSLADHLPEVRLDSGQYRQMLSNLLSNALKYSPSGTPVSVTTKLVQRDDKPWLVVSVSDYGVGMQADELARLGERFYRANPGGKVIGTGLGLSVVKELVSMHGGSMQFESLVGQGTRASLWFPAPGQA